MKERYTGEQNVKGNRGDICIHHHFCCVFIRYSMFSFPGGTHTLTKRFTHITKSVTKNIKKTRFIEKKRVITKKKI